ncbi:MAG TPA: hypothetical protein VK892_22105 [Pyrinomonadaceae bacterium]|nr:hypothetical protein [Pyrinomonadaceae bacterium]
MNNYSLSTKAYAGETEAGKTTVTVWSRSGGDNPNNIGNLMVFEAVSDAAETFLNNTPRFRDLSSGVVGIQIPRNSF